MIETNVQPERSTSTTPLSCPELLAPAGDWECAKAAVENGADAIYFGLEKFNARMRAHNFTAADLPKLMEFLHSRGVRGYVTFNTLVFADEMELAEEYLRNIIAAGVDAAIVQDVGICRLIRKLSPDFPIHGSTQMTVTSVAGIEFARDLGCQLVVLARECSVAEIEKIQSSMKSAAVAGAAAALPLEVFVHGALCVAYSGQCLTSESLGGRSANRGECAQACRMPYELLSDGKKIPLGDRQYLLSPQDLSGIEVLPDLIRLGLTSLKIEGRLKTAEYVANITSVYRKALDKIFPELARDKTIDVQVLKSEASYNLEMGFSRGLHSGWFKGINNQELVHARFGKKRGVLLGEILRVEPERVIIRLKSALKPGDGVVFDAGQPDQPEEGGRVYHVIPKGTETALTFGRGCVDFSRVKPGNKLWKTSDPELDKRLRQTFEGDAVRFQRPVKMEVHGHPGHPMTVIVQDETGHVCQTVSLAPLEAATRQPLDSARLEEQLGRLGGTPFKLGRLANHLTGDCHLAISELNRLRRDLVQQLQTLRARPRKWMLNEHSARVGVLNQGAGDFHREKVDVAAGRRAAVNESELIVMVRNLEQLDVVLKCGIETIYCEFEDPKKYRSAVLAAHESFGCAGPAKTIWVAPPRITKMDEEWILKQVLSSGADGYLVRNYDHLKFFKKNRMIGDFSLNVANPLAAEYFIKNFSLERLTASYDLNVSQLDALLRQAPPGWFEITIHQHMPMFHMEHCVFCAFLSDGTDFRNCGRPCDSHEVKIRDRVGAEHPLKADAGCRNTVFNSRAQTGAEFVEKFLSLGIRHFRLEFLNESADEVLQTITLYRKLLRGEIPGHQLWKELKLTNQLGVTRGQMEGNLRPQ